MIDPLRKLVSGLARWVAISGGVVLLILALVTVVGIIGRQLTAFGLHAVPGDFEIVQMGAAYAVCAFLPWVHLNRGHAAVPLFTKALGSVANRIIDGLVNLGLLAVSLILTWRLVLGLWDKFRYAETTYILQIPLWWGYAAALVGMVTWIVVALFCVFDRQAHTRTTSEQAGI